MISKYSHLCLQNNLFISSAEGNMEGRVRPGAENSRQPLFKEEVSILFKMQSQDYSHPNQDLNQSR